MTNQFDTGVIGLTERRGSSNYLPQPRVKLVDRKKILAFNKNHKYIILLKLLNKIFNYIGFM